MILFKEIAMGDVEDPELYAAVPIMDWENQIKVSGSWNTLQKFHAFALFLTRKRMDSKYKSTASFVSKTK